MIERMAVSLGLLVAFSITVMASIFADGAGEHRACMSAFSEAKVSACVKEIGLRSLIEMLANIVGSCSYVMRISVSFGSSRGIKAEIFSSSSESVS